MATAAFAIGYEVVTVLFLTISLFCLFGSVIMWQQGGRLLSIQTGSMRPIIRPADLVVVKPVGILPLDVGDIVSYHSSLRPGLSVTHRIVQINQAGSELTTQGDAVGQPDTPISARAVIGRVVAVIPYAGAVSDALRRPLGMTLVLYMPAAWLTMQEIRHLAASLSVRHYVYHGITR